MTVNFSEQFSVLKREFAQATTPASDNSFVKLIEVLCLIAERVDQSREKLLENGLFGQDHELQILERQMVELKMNIEDRAQITSEWGGALYALFRQHYRGYDSKRTAGAHFG